MGRIGVDSNVGFPGRDWGCGGGGGRHAVDGSGGEKRFVDLFHGEEEEEGEEGEEEEERERKRDERDERAAGLKLGLTGRQRRREKRQRQSECPDDPCLFRGVVVGGYHDSHRECGQSTQNHPDMAPGRREVYPPARDGQ